MPARCGLSVHARALRLCGRMWNQEALQIRSYQERRSGDLANRPEAAYFAGRGTRQSAYRLRPGAAGFQMVSSRVVWGSKHTRIPHARRSDPFWPQWNIAGPPMLRLLSRLRVCRNTSCHVYMSGVAQRDCDGTDCHHLSKTCAVVQYDTVDEQTAKFACENLHRG
jgi:hypothetical protein